MLPLFKKNISAVIDFLKAKPIALLLLFATIYRLVSLPGTVGQPDLDLSAIASGGVFTGLGELDLRWMVTLPTSLLYGFFGVNLFSTIILPVLISIFSVWLVYRILAFELPERTGLFAALLYAVVPLTTVFGSRLHPAVFMEGALLLSFFLIQYSVRAGSLFRLFLAAIAGGVALLAEPRAVWTLPVLAGYGFYRHLQETGSFGRKDIKILVRSRKAVLAGLFFATGFVLPLLLQCLGMLVIRGDFTAPLRNLFSTSVAVESLEYLKQLFMDSRGYSAGMFFPIVHIGFMAALVLIFKKNRTASVLLLWMVVPLLLLLLFAGGSPSVSSASVLIFLALPASALTAMLMEQLYKKKMFLVRVILPVCMVMVLLISLISGIDYRSRARSLYLGYRSALGTVSSNSGALYFGDRYSMALFRQLSGYSLKGKIVTGTDDIHRPGFLIVAKNAGAGSVFNKAQLGLIRASVPAGWKKLSPAASLEIWGVVPLTNLRAAVRKPFSGRIDFTEGDVLITKHAYAVIQEMGSYGSGWSGNSHLFIGARKTGATVVLRFFSKTGGRRRLQLAVTRASDFGRYSVALNGGILFRDLNLYSSRVVRYVFAPVPVVVRKGENRLTLKCIGKAASSRGIKGAIDTVELKPTVK